MPVEPLGPLDGVTETALGAAEMRAEESLRVDRLFNDQLAASFVAAAPPLFPDVASQSDDAELAALVESGITGVAIRTRYFDEHLNAACAAGCRQIVLLAAGLDSRAFRLDWPESVHLFELDLPELFEFKERVLATQNAVPRCNRRIVATDLRGDWSAQLTASGFEPDRVTAWVAEGLLVYLSADDAARLLAAVHDLSAHRSRLSLDYDLPDQDSTLARARGVAGMEEIAAMWQGGLENPAEWLRHRGWNVDSTRRAAFAEGCGRPLRDATGAFLTAARI
jgi:methyltransferase (TIGR00027 family)